MQVNVHGAKTNLSRLIAKAVAGKEVIIAKAGKPLVKLVKIEPVRQRRVAPGSAKDDQRLVLGPEWDSPETNAEIADLFGA